MGRECGEQDCCSCLVKDEHAGYVHHLPRFGLVKRNIHGHGHERESPPFICNGMATPHLAQFCIPSDFELNSALSRPSMAARDMGTTDQGRSAASFCGVQSHGYCFRRVPGAWRTERAIPETYAKNIADSSLHLEWGALWRSSHSQRAQRPRMRPLPSRVRIAQSPHSCFSVTNFSESWRRGVS